MKTFFETRATDLKMINILNIVFLVAFKICASD